MRNFSRAPRLYELMTILSPDVSEEDLPASVDRIGAYITDAGGALNETLRESPWGRRRLAYPIRHDGRDVRDGFYTVFHFELDPAKVEDVERELRLNDRVIRYLVTLYTPLPVDEAAEAVEGETATEPSAEAAGTDTPPGEAEAAGGSEPVAEAPPAADVEAAAEPAAAETTTEDEDEPSTAQAEAVAEEPAVVEDAPAEPADAETTTEADSNDGESAIDDTGEKDDK